jgi:hypothetical protein
VRLCCRSALPHGVANQDTAPPADLTLAAAALAAGAPLPNNTLVWAPLGEPGCGGDITAVRVNPFNTSQIFIAGDMLGIAVSLNDGATWSAPTPDSLLSWEMADFTFDPVLQRVYLAR